MHALGVAIAKELNARGIKAQGGSEWYSSAVFPAAWVKRVGGEC